MTPENLDKELVGALRVAALVAASSGEILHANDEASRLLARDPTGRSLMAESHEDDLAVMEEIAVCFRRADPGAALESLVPVDLDGEVRYHWLRILPEESSGGAPRRLVLLLDVTEAVSASPAVRRIFSQVNHDLRSPLTSISGAAELLLSGRVGALDAVPRRLVGIIEDGARKMTDILASAKGRLSGASQAASGGAE